MILFLFYFINLFIYLFIYLFICIYIFYLFIFIFYNLSVNGSSPVLYLGGSLTYLCRAGRKHSYLHDLFLYTHRCSFIIGEEYLIRG